MKIILLKRDILFIFVQVSVFWNFCKGYIQLCQDSNIGSPNGTTVTVEIGKPASVLFCVTSDRTVAEHALFDHPSHRRYWIRIKEKPDKFVFKFNIINKINITVDKVQRIDLNVVFSVKVYTELNNGNIDYDDFLILTFILQEQMTTTTMATTSSRKATTKPTEAVTSKSTRSRAMISESTTSIAMISKSTTSRAMISESTMSRATISESTTPRATISESTTSRGMITPPSVTDPASQCQPQATSRYPEEWLLVGDKYLVLLPGVQPRSSKVKCPNHGGAEIPDSKDISFFGPCLTYLLLNSSVKIIHIKNNEYLNVEKNAVESEAVSYRVVCIVPEEEFVPIEITEFTLEIWTSRTKKLHQDLIEEEDPLHVSINSTEDTLNLTCVGSGKPEPKVQISYDNVQQTTKQGRANHVKHHQAGCRNSGVYSCYIWNSFMSSHVQQRIEIRNRMKIQSFTITYTKVSIGGDVEMRCSVINCSSPYVLTLTDDANHTIAGPTDSALIHKITKVQCSDMGTYFCRGETPDGYIEEKREDLRVYRCPIQVCRGHDESKVVSAVVGQKLNISVCVMSDPNQWRYQGQNKDVSVRFTRRSQPSGIYYTAQIIFHNVTEHHHGNHIIRMENSYGSLNYTITIILQTATTTQIKTTTTTTTTERSTSHQPSTMTTANKAVPVSPSSEVHDGQGKPVTGDETQPLVIILLLVLLVIVLFVVVGVILYRMRGTLFSRLRERNTGDTRANNDTGQAEYANLRELDSVSAPAPDRRDKGEQETSVTNDGRQELLLQDTSSKDSGRVISEQGLVYVTVAQAANLSKKKKKPAQSKPKRTKKEPVEPVEYTTLDFEKTGKIVIAEEEDGKKDDGGNQENGSVDQREETGEKQKSDDKKE